MSASIESLSPNETGAMLKHRWLIAGGKDTHFPFTPDAIEQLFTYSKGILRTQIILADNALIVNRFSCKTGTGIEKRSRG